MLNFDYILIKVPLWLRMLFTQFDDDNQKFIMAYDNWSNNKTNVNYNSYEKECFIIV
jgi:hypothetical protein